MKVIKIGAVWCPGCLVMKPRWEKIEKQLPWLKTEYYDYDQDEEKIKKYHLKEDKLPVFIFLDKNNQEFLRLTGEYSEKKLIEIVQKNQNQ
jgi:thiol-disulfide isomerase/thioredoxin